ncbi:MAG TPA: class I SAM-dependent methyltransferase [Terriglobales bacterium]|nr:class I SAM-dependent methyltransferase [Terriglobales bacterium]
MGSPEVAQLGALSDLLAEVLARCRPPSLALLGIAGGNGLNRIDAGVTRRVVGIDVNPQYLVAVRERFRGLPGLELHCADLAEQTMAIASVQLVYAALLFEHAGTGRCLDNALALVAPGGNFAVVLQLPPPGGGPAVVSRSPAIARLGEFFSLIDPAWLCELLVARGLDMTAEASLARPEGKSFWWGLFRVPAV